MSGVAVGALVVVAMVAAFWLASRAADRQQARIDASKARAVPGTARVVSFVGNRSSIDSSAGVASGYDITLDVAVPGRDPFQVTVPWYLWPMAVPAVQVGASLDVRIDPHDDRLVYPENPNIETDTPTIVSALRQTGR